MSLTLSMDFQFKTTIEKLWSALTDSNQLSKWVADIHTGEGMENNFKPVVGHRFQFRARSRRNIGTGSSKAKCWSWRNRTGCPTLGKAEKSIRSPGRSRIWGTAW